MNRNAITLLRFLAQKGALEKYVKTSSVQLSKDLDISQQTVSRLIIFLIEQGYLTRISGFRSQELRITSKGLNFLKTELREYLKLFKTEGVVNIEGTLISGLGEGAYYMREKGYVSQIIEKLSIDPYPGTLNLRVSASELPKVEQIKSQKGITIEGFTAKNRTFGAVQAYLAMIENINAAVIFPKRTHYEDIVEIIADRNLREALKLQDGKTVKVSVFI